MLYDPGSHERLEGERWSESRAQEAIRTIVADAEAALPDGSFWPIHPADGDSSGVETTIYLGAAGVLWALDTLQSAGGVELRRPYGPVALQALEHYEVKPDFGERVPSLLMGEAGLLLVTHRLVPDAARADRLHTLVRDNVANETNELMWGSPGTMLAAQAMLGWTGEERWAAAWRESADRLWEEWRPVPEHGCDLWTQNLNGRVRQFIGPAHGFAGNVCVLALGGELLSGDRRAELDARAVATISTLAHRDGSHANWAPIAEAGLADREDGSIRVQWCHGSPGIVCSLADLAPDDDALTDLLVAGGELTWTAGPLAKGGGLCHGTAGNGYAFLKLLRRTGDERWLDRARAFAMHAIGQVDRARSAHGHGHYSLWTGDIGVALYLSSCLREDDGVPTIDVW